MVDYARLALSFDLSERRASVAVRRGMIFTSGLSSDDLLKLPLKILTLALSGLEAEPPISFFLPLADIRRCSIGPTKTAC
jgi:hypothetical protein